MTLTTAYLCMALNIHFESRGEPELGKKLVAQVTMNRAKGDVAQVCDEVLRPRQFEWTRKYVSRRTLKYNARPLAGEAWDKSQNIADLALKGQLYLHQKWQNVTHFHNTSVLPNWARSKNMQYLGKVGNHLFYCDKSISQR